MARPKSTNPRTCDIPRVRATPEELAQIEERRASSGLTMSAYIRAMAMNGSIIQRESIGDKHLLLALSPIGNNLNQSVKSLNELALSADAVGDPKTAAKLRETLAEIEPVLEQVRTIMEALIE